MPTQANNQNSADRQPASCRRQLPRYRRLKSGEVTFGKAATSCRVLNLSDAGAALQFQTTYGLPGTFELRLGSFTRNCRAAWATDTTIGVYFV